MNSRLRNAFSFLVKPISEPPGDSEHLNRAVRLEEDPECHFAPVMPADSSDSARFTLHLHRPKMENLTG